ncbi:probable ubiquitin-conjugating enzyme E2 24 [Olea europaea subsp. europaea]|uniref:E2 ubiquitin-conjugating enzyme n=1 Tax=Olea europaea subsp. europaea TaxID=158383 RepID=A0A8S0RWG1_OLEEU|nr:probable ubiquitin-conjugating enzyme E2 24 [Olea europaea subsp. europaea]
MDLLDTYFDSLSESSSSEDHDDIESLYGGQARSILSSLEETIGKIDDFLLFERAFMHGDIVCLASDPLGQMGKVINVELTVDLENIYGRKIHNVNSKNLQKIRSISVGDYVVSGAWLGKVDKIVDRITVLFDDGTKCELTTIGPEKIIAISPDILEDSQYPFYPGQKVQVDASSVSKPVGWLCGTRKNRNNQGTVCNVDAGLVYVDWLGCASVDGEKWSTPPCLQNSKNLTLLSCFPHANWQFGDWCVLPMEQIFPCAFSSGLVKGHGQSKKILPRNSLSPNFQEISVIVRTRTKIDVQWQDGSQSRGLDSHSLLPVNIVDVHDFWPDAFVMEKGTCDDSNVSCDQRWGVVRSVDSKERTVKVKWCNSTVSGEKEVEEIVSAYELVEHPDYSYCLGDAVFRMQKSGVLDLADENCFTNHTISKSGVSEESDLKANDNGEVQNRYPKSNFLSHIGLVVGFKDGVIEVKWATGATSKVLPYEIYRFDKCDGTTANSIVNDENIQQSNGDTADHENQLLGQKEKDVLDLNYNNLKDYSSYSLYQVAVGVFTSITSSLVGSLGSAVVCAYKRTSLDVPKLEIPTEEEALELCTMQIVDEPLVADDSEIYGMITSQLRSNEANEDIILPSGSKLPQQFRQFDMVSGGLDHHFVDRSGTGVLQSTQMKRGWLKKVHQEWSILEKDLSETIYVRVYEDRMDLLRAAIVGAPGTPYHDGLFFFDICLPPQYPDEPPMVHYNSGGLRINPNLYESGKVCLSILNTWTGSGTEVWNPGSSTILQVLLSLQALVLNEKPYFNEAGYDAHIGKAEGEKNSVSYNENAFLESCRSMMYLLRKPPKHFEELVKEHFTGRCKNILLACKAYMEGAPIGYPFGDSKPEHESHKGSSTGFKIMLGKLFPKLVEAFSDNDVDCRQMLHQVE